MEKPLKIRAWVTTGNTQHGARILAKNPLANSWAGELVEISILSAGFNLRNELMVEAISPRGETRTVKIEVFTTLSVADRERLYAAAIDRRSDSTSALKRQMTRAAGIPTHRDDDIAPPA